MSAAPPRVDAPVRALRGSRLPTSDVGFAAPRDRGEAPAAPRGRPSSRGEAFVTSGDDEHRLEAVDSREASCEPLAARGVYDLGASRLAELPRNAALSLAFDTGQRRPRPPETIFLQR